MAVGVLFQGAAKGAPGGAEAGGIGIEGLRAGEEGGVEGVGGAALGFEGAQVEAADAAIGGERGPRAVRRGPAGRGRPIPDPATGERRIR
jgi:hypothetical protein